MRRVMSVARIAAVLLGLVVLTPGLGHADRKSPSIDPLLRRMMRASEEAMAKHGRPEAIPEDEKRFYARVASVSVDAASPAVGVRLKLDPDARHAIERLGIKTFGRMEGFASAGIPIARLSEIAALPGIEAMQAVRIPKLELDVSRPEVLSTQAAVAYGATGRGVIFGNVDTGIDFTHPDFRNSDGTTRIKYLWRQDDGCVGTPPPAPFDYGCLYTEADINASLTGGPVVSSPDADGHGTHTTGVGAGNGRATGHGYPAGRYVGMAPEADIIMVKTFPEPGVACGNNCFQIGDALDFIDTKAGELGEPYVINLSLGSHYGGHDGTDLDEQTIDALVGPGIPGKAITKSVGNDRGHGIHVSGTVGLGVTNTHTFNIPAYTPVAGTFNDVAAWWLWYNNGDNLTVTINDPTTTACPGTQTLTSTTPSGAGHQVAVGTTSGFLIIDDTDSPVIPGGARSFHMEVDDQAGIAPCAGNWTMTVKGNSVPQGGHYDAWFWFSQFGAQLPNGSFKEALWTPFDDSKVISIPGTSFNVTTVGGYMTKYNWLSVDGNTYSFANTFPTDVGKLAYFSSPGPTRDNRQKPEITAPATAIASTLSRDVVITPFPGNQANVVEDGVHWALPGTSFSSPHVAGIFAQLLGLNPNLDAIQLRSLVTSTARTDANTTLPLPNKDWGYGKISALGMADQVVKSIPDLKPNLAGTFSWTGIPTATTYNVYRGDLSLKSPTYYGSCLLIGLTSPTFSDTAVPIVDAGFFYLVTGKKDGIEGILGFRSDGTPRPNTSPCP